MKAIVTRLLAYKYGWVLLLLAVMLINYLAALLQVKVDLTREKRYTLSTATKNLVRNLDEPVDIKVFLKGEFPSGFRKLAGSTRDFLGLLKDLNNSKIRYQFISPLDDLPGSTDRYADSLIKLGAIPINLTVQKKEGESSNIIFPVALLSYNGKQSLLNLYPGASREISQNEINGAEALMEYQFVHTLNKMMQPEKPAIAYATGNGEPVDGSTYDLVQILSNDYAFGTLNLQEIRKIPDEVDVLMIVKPVQPFTEDEKLIMDQFVMRGGKLLCFIDNLIAERDSLAFKPETIAYDRNLNLTDLFFRYGLRINTDLVMDLQCDAIPFVVGGTPENPQMEFLPWNYYPVLMASNSRLSRGLGYVTARFANSIDSIQAEGISKEPLLVTSPNSRIISTPALISLNENKNVPQHEKFKRNAIPVAMLLEGTFTSLYRNRVTKSMADTLAASGLRFTDRSSDSKIIVVADGDMLLNDFIIPDGDRTQPEPIQMGWNKYTYTEYLRQSEAGKYFLPAANRDFLLNCVEYLVNNPAIIETRNKDIILRLLDSKKLKTGKSTWQFINIGLPIVLVIIFGWLFQQIRKRKFA